MSKWETLFEYDQIKWLLYKRAVDSVMLGYPKIPEFYLDMVSIFANTNHVITVLLNCDGTDDFYHVHFDEHGVFIEVEVVV